MSITIEAGAFAYLVKPFREQDLLSAIQTATVRHGELLGARRELGRKPAVNRLDVVMPSASGTEWPLRFERSETGALSVSVVPLEERNA